MHETAERGPAMGPHVIFGFDTTGRCTLSTGPGLGPLRVRPGELVGRDLFEVYADDERSLVALRRVLAGETFSIEREFHGRILSVYYEPVRSPDGAITGALGVSTDVTEQRRAEAELRAARHRATMLADISAAMNREVLDPDALVRMVARSVGESFADAVTVWVRVRGRDELEERARWIRDGVAEPCDGEQPERPTSAEVEALGVLQVVHTDPGHAMLRVPLRSRGHLVGAIDITRSGSWGVFDDDRLDLTADIADRCALALDNALLLEAQREDREQLVKFKALADASDNLIAIADEQDRFVYTNPRIDEYGIEIDRDDVWATLMSYVPDATGDEIRRSLQATERWSGDLRIPLADHVMVAQLEVFHLHHPETGAALGTAWAAKDVTELRTTEAALRAVNADLMRFKALVEASPDFIAIAGLDGAVTYVNPGGRELIGLDPEVDVTKTTITDYLTPEGIRASLEIEQPAVVATGHWEGESTLRNHRGAPVPVEIVSFLMHDPESGEPFALATVQRDISERLAAEAARQELAEQQQALLTRLVDAQDAERTRIAADVHDDPVQALAAVDLRLGLLNRRLRERAPDLLETLEPLQASVSGATERLRSLLFDLEPPDLQRGLSGALARAAEEIFELSDVQWTVDGEHEPDVPNAVRAIAYRIAKETLNNTRKHAGARHVAVTVRGRDGGIEVSVADDGVGLGATPAPPTPGHRGLLTMQDRATIAGGWCALSSPPGGGTVVTTWLPGSDAGGPPAST
ncbi:PAS domain S-box protein [Nocardioides sp. MAHUQ-72]|uniref:PAS domain S-box protein n=1 Tax=unclassified Nocardioides TaxID=2615069 RepID=UPI00361FEBBE